MAWEDWDGDVYVCVCVCSFVTLLQICSYLCSMLSISGGFMWACLKKELVR